MMIDAEKRQLATTKLVALKGVAVIARKSSSIAILVARPYGGLKSYSPLYRLGWLCKSSAEQHTERCHKQAPHTQYKILCQQQISAAK